MNWWSVAAIATMGAALTACGSGGDSSNSSSVRVANATLTHPSIDLLVAGSVVSSANAADTVSAYVAPASGVTTLQINDSGSATSLATTTPSLSGNLHYTLLAYESGGIVRTAILNEDYTTPAASAAQLRIYNAAPDAGKLDVYITATTVTSLAGLSPSLNFTTGVTPLSSVLITESVGAYKVWITGYSNAADIRAVVPSVSLASQQIGTVILTPASGGVLLNAATLIQQGVYAATRNTNARVRLAAAVSGTATVTASATTTAGTVAINAGSAAPWFDYAYTLVPATSSLNTTVNGNSVAITAPATLTAGADFTLFVYGSPTSSTARVLADDNRPPTDTTTTKVRLINGITGNVGSLTLTANNALVASALAPGQASTYASVLGSSLVMNLTLTSSLTPGNLLTNSLNTLNAGTVWTVLAAGDIGQPVGSLTGPQLLVR